MHPEKLRALAQIRVTDVRREDVEVTLAALCRASRRCRHLSLTADALAVLRAASRPVD